MQIFNHTLFDEIVIGRCRLQFFSLPLWQLGVKIDRKQRAVALPFMSVRVY